MARRSGHTGSRAINIVIQIGFALCMASSVLFHLRLYQLNALLRESYPLIWKTFGSGNEDLSRLAQYTVMTRLATRYRVNDPALNQRFMTLRRLHQSGAIGVTVVGVGLAIQLMG
jgi:hypothetical protein